MYLGEGKLATIIPGKKVANLKSLSLPILPIIIIYTSIKYKIQWKKWWHLLEHIIIEGSQKKKYFFVSKRLNPVLREHGKSSAFAEWALLFLALFPSFSFGRSARVTSNWAYFRGRESIHASWKGKQKRGGPHILLKWMSPLATAAAAQIPATPRSSSSTSSIQERASGNVVVWVVLFRIFVVLLLGGCLEGNELFLKQQKL